MSKSTFAIKWQLDDLFRHFSSASLINTDGLLLYSKDEGSTSVLTTKLVVSQIFRKYLSPRLGDVFMMNDPENGAYSYRHLFFFAPLTSQLSLVWHQPCPSIDFKIPPTPLLDQGVKNDFAWQALLSGREPLTHLVLEQIQFFKDLQSEMQNFKDFDLIKTQQTWLKASQQLFEQQLNQKAVGVSEVSFALPEQQLLKLTLSIEEKNQIKNVVFDFTNTSPAKNLHVASHIAESILLQTLASYYKIQGFITQPVLDKIKIILPPKSIISKAHNLGYWNYEVQDLVAQMTQYAFNELNNPSRKKRASFQTSPTLRFSIKTEATEYMLALSHENHQLSDLEKIQHSECFEILSARKQENVIHFKLQNKLKKNAQIVVHSLWPKTLMSSIKINGQDLTTREQMIQPQESIELHWTLVTPPKSEY